MINGDLSRFLVRACRQWTVWSIIEHAAIGLLTGCCCDLLLLPILLWRGQPAQTFAAVLPIVGSILGAIVGVRRRPRLAEVARLADLRFNTGDLLATAMSLHGSAGAWNLNILSMADACASKLSPAALTPHRLGQRAWSAVVLSLVAVGTLIGFSVTMQTEQTMADVSPVTPGSWNVAGRAMDGITSAASRGERREARAEASADSGLVDGTESERGEARGLGKESDGRREDREAASGVGGNSARTGSSHADQIQDEGVSLTNQSPAGKVRASGGRGAAVRAEADRDSTAGQVAGEAIKASAWAAGNMSAARGDVSDISPASTVPDAYRDLVRDYFQQN